MIIIFHYLKLFFTCANLNIVLSLHAENIKHQTIINKRLY